MRIIIQPANADPRIISDAPYNFEDILERHIAHIPDLIPIEEATGESVRLLTIGNQVTAGPGAIDILLLGSDAVLTIVETKLAENREIRRKVLGQVLEYAAYVSEWGIEELRAAVEKNTGRSLSQELADFLDAEADESGILEEFMERLARNLKDGRLRLIVASDQLVDVTLKTITFINQHSDFEIYLLQVTCYEDEDGTRVYVPSLHGYTPKSRSARTPKQWDWELYRTDLGWGADEVAQAKALNDRLEAITKAWNPEYRFKGGWTNFYFGSRKSPCGVTRSRAHGVELWFRLSTNPELRLQPRVHKRKRKEYLCLYGELDSLTDEQIADHFKFALDQIRSEDGD